MAKDSYWFRHDSSAGRGTRMRKMQHIYGHWGKGIYWDVIELLRDQDEYKHESDTSSLQMLCDLIGCKDESKFINWLKDCIKLNLFIEDGGFFFSAILIENMTKWETKKRNGSETKAKLKRNGSEIEAKHEAKRKHKIREDKIREDKMINKSPILFLDCEYFNNPEKIRVGVGEKYIGADIDFYHEAALNWSNSGGNKKKDWLATIRGFMQRDKAEGKLRMAKAAAPTKKEIDEAEERRHNFFKI